MGVSDSPREKRDRKETLGNRVYPKENVPSKVNLASCYTIPKTSLEALSTFKVQEKKGNSSYSHLQWS